MGFLLTLTHDLKTAYIVSLKMAYYKHSNIKEQKKILINLLRHSVFTTELRTRVWLIFSNLIPVNTDFQRRVLFLYFYFYIC